MPDGQGFVRPKFNPGHKDAVIGSMQIRRYSLRMGDLITGVAKAPKQNEKYWSLVRIDKINGLDLLAAQNRAEFKDLVPIYPVKQVKLEFDSKMFSTRIIDIFVRLVWPKRDDCIAAKSRENDPAKRNCGGSSGQLPRGPLDGGAGWREAGRSN